MRTFFRPMGLVAHAALVAAPLGARPRARHWSSLFGIALGWLAWPAPSAAAGPTLAFDDPAPHDSHDGAVQLSWPGGLGDYEVQLRSGEHTRVAYRGRMPSAHVSGLLEGDYTVHLRAHDGEGWSPWSAAKPLRVRHHPRPMVYALVSLGFLTFVGTAGVVLRSSRAAA